MFTRKMKYVSIKHVWYMILFTSFMKALQQGALEEEQHQYQSPTRASAHSIEVDEDGVVIEPTNSVTQRVAQAIDATPEYPHKSPSSEWNKSASTPSYSARAPIDSDMRGLAVSAEYEVSEASEHSKPSSYSASPSTNNRDQHQYDRSPCERQGSDQTINTTRTSDTSSGASRSPKGLYAEIKAYQKLLQTESPTEHVLAEQPIERIAEPRKWQAMPSTRLLNNMR